MAGALSEVRSAAKAGKKEATVRAPRIVDGKPVITEKMFQEQVRKAALLNGWLYYHTFNAYRSPEGFPDVCMVHPKKFRLIFAELKSEKGKLGEKQREWIEALNKLAVSVEVYVLKPSDFDWFWKVLSE